MHIVVRRGTSRRRSYSFSDVVNSHTHNADDGIDFSLSSPLPPHLLHKSLTLDREEEKEGIEVGGMEDQEAEGLLHISKRSDFVRTAVLLSTPSSSALSPSSSLFNISREEKKSKNRGEKRAASPQRNEGRSISSDSNEESLLQRDELSSKESKDFARSKSKESHDDFHEAVADLEELQWLNRNLQLENRQLVHTIPY